MLTKKQRVYFDMAKKVSELSDHPRYKIGAVVVLNRRIISSGYNSHTKTHPTQRWCNQYRFDADGQHKLHAEVAALLPLIKDKVDLSKASIYTYREHKNGQIAISKPCAGCMALLKNCGISTIGYTTEDRYVVQNIEYFKKSN